MTISDFINSMLALLTGLYVYFTYRLLKTATNTNETNKKLLSEQFRLTNFPTLSLTTYINDDSKFLKISNLGSSAAYDLDIWVILTLSCEDITPEEYFKKFVRDDSKKFINMKRIKKGEDLFYISDRGLFPILTQKKSIHVPLNYSTPNLWFFSMY